jgi:hypothetical protein
LVHEKSEKEEIFLTEDGRNKEPKHVVELNKINIKMYAYSWVFGKVKQTLV